MEERIMSEDNFNPQEENEEIQREEPERLRPYQQYMNGGTEETGEPEQKIAEKEVSKEPVWQGSNQGSQMNYQQGYQQNNSYNPYMSEGSAPKKESNILGILSMVFGIISLVFFCACINFPLGIAAIILGIIQLVKKGSKGMAIAGLVTGGISILAGFFFWMVMFTSADFQRTFANEFNNRYYDEFFDDFYDDDTF